MEFSELQKAINELKKQYKEISQVISDYEKESELNDIQKNTLAALRKHKEEIKKQLESLGIYADTEMIVYEGKIAERTNKDLSKSNKEKTNEEKTNNDKYKELSARELELLNKCKEKIQEIDKIIDENKQCYSDELADQLDNAEMFLEKVAKKENIENREEILENLYLQLCAKKSQLELMIKKEEEDNSLTKLKKAVKKHWKKVAAIVLVGAMVMGISKCDLKKAPKEETPNDEPKIEYDQESYEYFINNGVRKSDAEKLAENSMKLMNRLNENDVTDIKVNDIDELLLDIYDGHNITSSAENYDSLDTFTSLENAATVDVFNNIAGVPGYENIDYDKCANLVNFVDDLDINQDSSFDTLMERLSEATEQFFKNKNDKVSAQNLIDVIYDVNKNSGKLNASEEGMITEYILAVGPTLYVLYPELKVTGTNINPEHLINHIVAEIEVFEQDSCYTRTLN